MFTIIEKNRLNENTTKMVVSAPLIAKKAMAGQFIILRVSEYGERIPLTIADYDRKEGTVTIIYQKIGRTTMLLDKLNIGDAILNFTGPLGRASKIEGYKSVAIIVGGVGCAIAYPQAKALNKSGAKVDIIAGFRNKSMIILEDDMRSLSDELILMTDDGSNGNEGFVTDGLRSQIQSGKNYDLVIAIGPIPMMKAVSNLTKEFNIKTIVSMNPIMIDGTGMCGGCRLTVAGETKFACIDGPDFDGHEVDFDEAIKRLGTFEKHEKTARDKSCNLIKDV